MHAVIQALDLVLARDGPCLHVDPQDLVGTLVQVSVPVLEEEQVGDLPRVTRDRLHDELIRLCAVGNQ